MKNTNFLLLLFLTTIIVFACTKANTQTETVIEKFPIEGSLVAEIKKIPPVAMTPHNIFVSGNHLVLYNARKDTLFDVFTIPDLEWKFAAGIQGQGPQDFYQLERRYIHHLLGRNEQRSRISFVGFSF